MKKCYFLSITILFLLACNADDALEPEVQIVCNNTFDGDIVLNTQQNVEAFASQNYDCINGNLKILGAVEDPITSLASLTQLKSVNGLEIFGTSLIDLQGLENMQSIEDYIRIEFTPLKNLDALTNVGGVTNSLIFFRNRELKNLNGFQNMQVADDGIIFLSGNIALEGLAILKNIIPENLKIFTVGYGTTNDCPPDFSCDPPLIYLPNEDFSFLNKLKTVERLSISGYLGENLQGLQNIESIGTLRLLDNPNLNDLTALVNVSSPMTSLNCYLNPLLSTLDGLENVPYYSSEIIITSNESLEDYCALENSFQGVEPDEITISNNLYNPSMQDIINGDCSL